MDIDIVVKIGTFFIGLAGVAKLLYELQTGNRGRMRDEYRFAREFFTDKSADGNMHPYLREKGYQAIAGDTRLSADEIEYLLSLKGAHRALKDYVLGRAYLDHFPQHGDLQIDFKEKYKRPWARRIRKYTYGAAYAALSFMATSPLILSQLLFKRSTDMLAASCLTFIMFIPYAWLSLRSAVRIDRAEKLVLHQDKHTKAIVIDSQVGARSQSMQSSIRQEPIKAH